MKSSFRYRNLAGVFATVIFLHSLPSQAQTSEAPKTPLFFCKEVFDPASGEQIPATLVWIPERKGNIRLIAWKSEFFSDFGLTPQDRCSKVTQKFQKRYDAGQLDFLGASHVKGYPVVCGLSQAEKKQIGKTADICNEDNQLFTLKPHDDPDYLLKKLTDILEGKSADLLYQSTNSGKTLIPVPEFFRRVVITDDQPPKRRKDGGTYWAPPSLVPDGQTSM
ncbi:COP23 domain-containing protein [Acaryochloris marina NIES-2412]|uniref:COP23 domain-containing protein n=1 Tax=Acaryochloris marina TaxID=155978 RepID=UPI0040582648